MSELERLSFSLERPLSRKLERLVKAEGYTNRSEFIRDLIRQRLVQHEWDQTDKQVVGTVTMIYDHHARQLSDRLTHIQHHHHDEVLASTHVHLDKHLCAEMIMMKGSPDTLRKLADELRKQKGVLHAELSISSTGRLLK